VIANFLTLALSHLEAMLHLAKVIHRDTTGKAKLELLACKHLDNTWAVLEHRDQLTTSLDMDSDPELGCGALILVEMSHDQQIEKVQDATGWLLSFISDYLSTGITPSFLQQEAERAERWRQSLTLESQELRCRALEVEARREQMQVLEENLRQEKQDLEASVARLNSASAKGTDA